MQNISDTISKGTSAVKDTANEVIEYLKSNPRLASMLLAGGGAGLAGGMLTAGGAEREGETKGSRRLRILRNALLSGAAGAGAAGLGSEAFSRMEQAIPADQPHPLSAFLTGPEVRGAGGVAGALAGMGAGRTGDINDELIAGMSKLKDTSKGVGPLSTFKTLESQGVSPAGRANFVKRHLPADAHVEYSSPLNAMAAKIKDPKVKATLQKILGGRGRQLGVLGGAAGLFAPEILGKLMDTLEVIGE